MTRTRYQKSFQKTAQRKNRLWLLVVSPLLSLVLISSIKPSGPFAFWTEISIFCLSSVLCGFALAMKQFDTVKHRFWGTMAFSAGGMYLICCLSFLGCFWPGSRPPSPGQIQKDMRQEEMNRKAWAAKHITNRDALADPSMLDLTRYYDGVIPGPRPKNGPLRIQQPGTHLWDEIKFDVRGTVGSDGLVETNTVPVNRKCSEVDFLHGADAEVHSGLVNQFFIHFQNGDTKTISIVYGTDVSSEIFENGVVPTNAVVWIETLATNSPPQPFAGYFITRWKNPAPEETITSIGFAPRPTAFLVAITVQEAKN